jgi:hypothetical protein
MNLDKAPFPFYLLRPTSQEYHGSKLLAIARRVFGFVLGCAVFVIGLGLLFVKPWPVFTCHRVGPGQTHCRLEKRIAWVNSWQAITVTGVREARVWSDRAKYYEEDGQWRWVPVYDVLLVGDAGEVSLGSYDETWALDAQAAAGRINAFLDDPTRGSLKLYGRGLGLHTLSTLASWTLLLFTGTALSISIVSSTLLLSAWTADGVLSAAERAAHRRERSPGARERVARLRRAVREIAVRPNGDD